jgi:membrane-associated phospholipid phosphatase
MTEEQFIQISEHVRNTRYGELLVNLINKIMTYIVFAAYPGILIYVYFYHKANLLECVMVPAISFITVTVFRNIFNAKRPYEVYNFNPIIKKDTSAHSFPSRHVFSAFMIGMTCLVVNPAIAAVIFVMASALAVLRVIGGVHFVRDVASGAMIGIISGIIGYFFIF